MPDLATRTILSSNHYASWEKGQPRAVVVHSTRSTIASKTDAQELQSTINWFMSINSQASAHWVVSELERVRMVEDKYPAWHAVEHSWESYGIEITQPTIDRPYTEGHYRNLVAVCIPYVRAGIPVVHLPTLEWQDGRRGFVGHEETEQGLRDGKSDPGLLFDWSKFLTMLEGGETDMMLLYHTVKGVYLLVNGYKRALDGPREAAYKSAGIPRSPATDAAIDALWDEPSGGGSPRTGSFHGTFNGLFPA